MEYSLVEKLEMANRRGGVHYYVIISDLDTELVLKLDQTADGNTSAPVASFRVLYTKLNLYMKGVQAEDLNLTFDIDVQCEMNMPPQDQTINAMVQTVLKSMELNKRAIYGK